MNTTKNTPETPVNPSRRFFLGASVALAASTLVGCGSSDLPEQDQVNLAVPRGDKDFILKNSLFNRIDNIHVYFRLMNTNFEMIDGIKAAKIQDSENKLIIQIGSGFLMGDDCLLITGSMNNTNINIIYKDGKIKNQKGNMSYTDLADMISFIERQMKF